MTGEAIDLLRELAACVGCAPEAFFGGRTGIAHLDQDTEMWRLWTTLVGDGERERALVALRGIAAGTPRRA